MEGTAVCALQGGGGGNTDQWSGQHCSLKPLQAGLLDSTPPHSQPSQEMETSTHHQRSLPSSEDSRHQGAPGDPPIPKSPFQGDQMGVRFFPKWTAQLRPRMSEKIFKPPVCTDPRSLHYPGLCQLKTAYRLPLKSLHRTLRARPGL